MAYGALARRQARSVLMARDEDRLVSCATSAGCIKEDL
jgi:hypothetical protein